MSSSDRMRISNLLSGPTIFSSPSPNSQVSHSSPRRRSSADARASGMRALPPSQYPLPSFYPPSWEAKLARTQLSQQDQPGLYGHHMRPLPQQNTTELSHHRVDSPHPQQPSQSQIMGYGAGGMGMAPSNINRRVEDKCHCGCIPTGDTEKAKKENLRRHTKQVHRSGEKFKCQWPECDKEYTRRDTLTAHRKTHGNPVVQLQVQSQPVMGTSTSRMDWAPTVSASPMYTTSASNSHCKLIAPKPTQLHAGPNDIRLAPAGAVKKIPSSSKVPHVTAKGSQGKLVCGYGCQKEFKRAVGISSHEMS